MNLDGTSRQRLAGHCKPGDHLRLVRDRRSMHNVYAIEVWTQDSHGRHGHQLGFIPVELSKQLATHMDARAEITAKVAEVTGGTGMLWWRKPYHVELLLEGIPE
jgi:hypothetical protein